MRESFSYYIDLIPKLKLQSNKEGSIEFYKASITFGFNSFILSSDTKYAVPFPASAALLINSLLQSVPIPKVNNYVELLSLQFYIINSTISSLLSTSPSVSKKILFFSFSKRLIENACISGSRISVPP
jgi:hypothetical protein